MKLPPAIQARIFCQVPINPRLPFQRQVPVAAGIVSGALVAVVFIAAVFWMRRRHRRPKSTKLVPPVAVAHLAVYPHGARNGPVYEEPELPDSDILEMSDVPGSRAVTTSIYTELTADHKTYTQASDLMLPGQMCATAAAAANEEPVPQRRWNQQHAQRPSNAAVRPHVEH